MAFYHPPTQVFAIPKDWDMNDVSIKHGVLYYRGEEQDCPNQLMDEEADISYPQTIEDVDFDTWASCFDWDEEI